jgi:hypothetical protein
MSKAGLDLKDFSIASRKVGARPDATSAITETGPAPVRPTASDRDVASVLPKPSEKQKREAAEERAIAQEDVRNSLKNLKRAKQRNVKFFVNVALDYEMKGRLQRAAQENDLKMTAVVKAALDYFLSENGY